MQQDNTFTIRKFWLVLSSAAVVIACVFTYQLGSSSGYDIGRTDGYEAGLAKGRTEYKPVTAEDKVENCVSYGLPVEVKSTSTNPQEMLRQNYEAKLAACKVLY